MMGGLRYEGGDFFLQHGERRTDATSFFITKPMKRLSHEVITDTKMRQRALDALDNGR
jgi:hypothetical protein